MKSLQVSGPAVCAAANSLWIERIYEIVQDDKISYSSMLALENLPATAVMSKFSKPAVAVVNVSKPDAVAAKDRKSVV